MRPASCGHGVRPRDRRTTQNTKKFPPLHVNPQRAVGDRVQLQQVIINLVMNGIEAMQSVTDRPRELVIRSRHDEKQQVMASVTDCGVGIATENADRLFNAFFTTKSSGMGMGLSICRSIMEAHDGRLWATANIPHGATFQFTLPVDAETSNYVRLLP